MPLYSYTLFFPLPQTSEPRLLLSTYMMRSGHESVSFATSFRYVFLTVYNSDGLLTHSPRTGNSTQTMLNKHSRQLRYQHCNMPSLPLKTFVHHERRPQQRLITRALSQLLLLGWQSLTAITSKVLSQLLTSWQWVRCSNSCIIILLVIVCIVLDPSRTMSYFHKHWAFNPSLISDVEDTVQTRVTFFSNLA